MAMKDATTPSEHFSLRPLAGALRSLRPPGEAPTASGAWAAEFRLFSLAGAPRPQGRLSLARTPHPSGFELKTEYVLGCGAGVEFVTVGKTVCAGDALATPRTWSVTTRQTGAGGEQIKGSAGGLEGAYDGGRVVLSEYGEARSLAVEQPLSWGWGLFEAVQRLATAPRSEPLQFSLLDHFDQVKHGHSLRLRKRCRLTVGGKLVVEERVAELDHGTVYRPQRVERGGTAVDCVVFEQTGRGILPIVYWCTADGRLLMVSSGLEAYVRKTGGQSNG